MSAIAFSEKLQMQYDIVSPYFSTKTKNGLVENAPKSMIKEMEKFKKLIAEEFPDDGEW